MISKLRKELQNRKRDNKGAALIMVIIAIAFVGMLVAMVLYMAYCNYLMKANDTQAKDNFYSAEYALDIINAGLQQDISECMSEAYVTTMNNSSGKDAEMMELEFQQEYIRKLKYKLQDRSGGAVNPDKWDVDHLQNFWKNTSDPSNPAIKVASTAGEEGAYLGINGDNKMDVNSNNQYLTLYDLKVVYTDEKGFVSIITTDVRLRVPEIGFAQAATRLSLENYSLIANKSLINDHMNDDPIPSGMSLTKGSDVLISGNVFGGYKGVVVANQKKTSFIADATDQSSGVSKAYQLITDSINVNNTLDSGKGLYVDDTYETYVTDINVYTARMNLEGKVFTGDDLDIGGKGSQVTLAGEYIGYGNALGVSDGSSSILINGGETDLDFSSLDKLTLSGHAYVGAKKYDADKDRYLFATKSTLTEDERTNYTGTDKITDEDTYDEQMNLTEGGFVATESTIPENETNFMMGESVSVKANQLLYLVPPECIGYNKKTGEQVVAKNPMTYEEYQKLLTKVEVKDEQGNVELGTDGQPKMEDVYDPVRLDKLWAKLGNVSYTNDYKAVYRRVNGSVLVYLYLDFKSSEIMANEFYKAYYQYDKEGIDNYVNSYIDTMKWNSALESNLTLAGNAFNINSNNEVVFIESDLNDPDQYAKMVNLQTEYSEIHESLMHSLQNDITMLTSTQQSSEIFNSLVDSTKLTELSGLVFKDDTGNIEARITDGNIMYPSTACPNTTKLIVAKGDIYLNGDFKGLAIAGGNIYVCNRCSKIEYSPTEVLQAMRAKANKSGTEVYAYQVFGTSGEISYANGGAEIDDVKVSISDLILYQDWKKE